MDINKLRTLVFEKTGIRVDTGDPVFALVALNEAVLSECIEQHIEVLHQAAVSLREQTAQLIAAGERYQTVLQQVGLPTRSGDAPQVVSQSGSERPGNSTAIEKAQNSGRPTGMQWILGAAGVAILTTALTLAGGRILQKETPAPSIPTKLAEPRAPLLTPEQIAMIENGEKFSKMWPKLDATTQAKIKRILQQP